MPKVLERKEKVEEKILEKLDRIENLLIKVLPAQTELTEEDVLKIIEEGDRAYREGRTVEHDEFIKKEYPQYAHLLRRDHSKVSKSVSKIAPRS